MSVRAKLKKYDFFTNLPGQLILLHMEDETINRSILKDIVSSNSCSIYENSNSQIYEVIISRLEAEKLSDKYVDKVNDLIESGKSFVDEHYNFLINKLGLRKRGEGVLFFDEYSLSNYHSLSNNWRSLKFLARELEKTVYLLTTKKPDSYADLIDCDGYIMLIKDDVTIVKNRAGEFEDFEEAFDSRLRKIL